LNKIRVGIVNYLNTRPLLYGLERPPIRDFIELSGAYPSKLSQALINGDIDLGLIPVAAIPFMKEYHIIGNHCIGANGEIASVAIFCDVPIQEIEKIYLDYQSRTSVALCKYLLKEYWGIHPEIIQAEGEQYRGEIKGTTAGLVIGDRAFRQRKISNYIYDLGSAWKAITGLPFVFAAWVSNKPLPEDFILAFDEANETGIKHIDEIVAAENFDLFDLRRYYTLHLDYHLDENKREAMAKFLELIR
jgi:chorismate dehydratase